LHVDGYDLPIVGIYRCGSLLLDVAIILDGASVRRIAKIESGVINSVYFEPDGTVPNDQLVESIKNHFRGRGGDAWQPTGAVDLLTTAAKLLQSNSPTEPGSDKQSDEGIEVRTANDWSEKIQELSGDLDIFLWLMTAIGVVIALLSILNTMLMSVAERMIEFGVLKANGWSSWDVLRLITWESALLGVMGGMLGCAFGWTAVQVVNWWFPTKVHLHASPGLLTFSLGFSTLLGIAGGLYPAYWAVRMSPMDAIRRG
jgi:putative ABC transport system permease protein